MNNFSVLECPVYFDKTNMLDMLSLSAGRAILCQNRLGEQIIAAEFHTRTSATTDAPTTAAPHW